MDILIKFVKHKIEEDTGLENHFPSLKKVQKYFLKLEKKNDNCFFHPRKGRRFDAKDGNQNVINKDDYIYFVFEQRIIARAIYVSEPDFRRDDKFKHGYKVKKIILLGTPISLNKLTKNPFSNQNSIYFIKKEDTVLQSELKEIFE